MRVVMKLIFTMLICISDLIVMKTATAQELLPSSSQPVWTVENRLIPVPGDISDVMRNSIVNTTMPDTKLAKQFKPQSDQEWQERKEKTYAARKAQIEKELQHLAVTVTTDVIDGVTVRYITPQTIDPNHSNHLFVDIHSGAFLLNSGELSIIESIYIASRLKISVLSIDYRTLPEHQFPSALDDVVTVYQNLLKIYPSKSIILGGSSAGSNLAFASIFKLKELGLDLPGALYAGTPWSDLTKTGDTQYINEGIDRLLVSNEGLLSEAARLYAGHNDMKKPLISPVYGDFKGFPPTYLVTGSRDLFLSDTARIHRKLREAGVIADLNVYEGMSHADYIFVPESPESKQVYKELNEFVLKHTH